MMINTIHCGDALDILAKAPARSFDLVMTSPPYADQRKDNYGGVAPDDYVAWFTPIAAELKRTLKPTGSFVLNIKEKVVKGERHPYVIQLILALREMGWRWVDEYVWHKKNCSPGKWPNRFRDAWERCLHFSVDPKFHMDQEAVMVPMGDWKHSRLKKVTGADGKVSVAVDVQDRDMVRAPSGTGNKFAKRIANWVGRDRAYPSNVLHLATECGNKGHSAAYPEALPTFFIKLLCPRGGNVLDPFVGSGTTAVAAKRHGRAYVGIDLLPENVALATRRVADTEVDASPKRYRGKVSDVGIPYGETTVQTFDTMAEAEAAGAWDVTEAA